MRILFWSELFWPYGGGVEVLAAKVLPALSKRNYEFIVVTSHDYLDLPDEEEYKGIPVYRFPFREALSSGNFSKLISARQGVVKVKKRFAPDLVHASMIGPSTLFHLQTLEAHPAPFLLTLQMEISPTNGSHLDTLQSKVVSAADWVTSCSASALGQAIQLRKEIESHSSVIYNAVDVPDLIPKELPSDSTKLLCIGRLVPQKGFDLALSAFAGLVDRFPALRMIIAGDGSERKNLEKQTVELGLTNFVDFLGWILPEKVSSLINTATTVVMPSRHEGLPIVAIQAALMARPVVGTRVGGLSEVVIDRHTGLLIEKENITALRDALTYILENPEHTRQMGQAARLRAKEVFSFQQNVNAYDELYRKLILKGFRNS